MRNIMLLVFFFCAVHIFFNSVNLFASQLPTASTLQQIYEAEDHRQSNAQVFAHLQIIRKKSDLVAALTALGRIGDAASEVKVSAFLKHSDKEVRNAAAQALGLIGGSNAIAALSLALDRELRPDVSGAIALALGHAGSEAEVAKISPKLLVLRDERAALANAVEGLGHLFNKDSAKWNIPPALLQELAQLTTRDDVVAVAAGFALTRYKGDVKNFPLNELKTAFQSKEIHAAPKALVARILGKIKSTDALAVLIDGQAKNDSIGVRSETARALANYGDQAKALAALSWFLNDKSTNVVIQALQSVQSIKSKGSPLEAAILHLVKTGSVAIRAQAIQTLAALNPVLARSESQTLLKSNETDLIVAAIATLGSFGSGGDVSQILPMLNHKNVRISGAAIGAIGGLAKDQVPKNIIAAFKQVLMRRDAGLTAGLADAAASLELKDFAVDIAAAYPLYSPDEIETKLGILAALEKIGSKDQLKTIELALRDDERLVVQAAAATFKAITGTDVSSKVPATSTVRSKLPSMVEIHRATRAMILMQTTRGEIQIQMTDAAPLAAYNFVKLVREGFYNNRSFHRVVPNFVAQGGDPRGDGFGGPGYLIRDQVSSARHMRGTIGMATAGKDTAGSQFFINLAPNLHLDGVYTVFGYVLYGMDVSDNLEQGDLIIDTQVL